MRRVEIAGRALGDGCAPFIVAEAGINHCGHLDTALEMIYVAKAAGCDAIKFATLKASEFCNPSHMISYRFKGQLVTEPEIEMFRRTELPDYAWKELKRECDAAGIIFFSTPQNESDLALLLEAGVPCIKVGSDDLTNLDLIWSYASHGLPLILSTGMADPFDILQAVSRVGGPLVILACTSEYPCPLERANVLRVATLQALFPGIPIGYSDHTQGWTAGGVAAALGAAYIEKHFTLNNAARGPDHEFSAGPVELAGWVASIKNAYRVRGHGRIEPTEQERINRQKWRRVSGQQIRGERKEAA